MCKSCDSTVALDTPPASVVPLKWEGQQETTLPVDYADVRRIVDPDVKYFSRDYSSKMGPDGITRDWWALWRDVGDEWVTSKGKFPKRLARALHKIGIELSATQRAKLGELYPVARLAVRESLDWEDGDFGDDGSCFFSEGGCNEHMPQALQDAGGFAITAHNPDGGGIGRCLVFPITDKEHSLWLLFNAYGLCLKDIAKSIVASQPGLVATPAGFSGNRNQFYVNTGSGADERAFVVIHPAGYIPRTAYDTRDYGLNAETEPQYTCCVCDYASDDEDAFRHDDNGYCYCDSCYCERYAYCECCSSEYDSDDSVETTGTLANRYTYVCSYCASHGSAYRNGRRRSIELCASCSCAAFEDELYACDDGEKRCDGCSDQYHTCEDCGQRCKVNHGHTEAWDGKHYCDDCEVPEQPIEDMELFSVSLSDAETFQRGEVPIKERESRVERDITACYQWGDMLWSYQDSGTRGAHGNLNPEYASTNRLLSRYPLQDVWND